MHQTPTEASETRPPSAPPVGALDGADLADPLFAEALFDRLADVVFFVKDAHGRYVVVNSTLMRRCGCAHKGSLIGHSPLEVFPPELGRCIPSERSQSRM